MIQKIILSNTYKEIHERPTNNEALETIIGNNIDREILKTFIHDAEVLYVCAESAMPLDRELLSEAHQLRFISIDTTDFSWVDMEYCKQNAITVSNSPHVSTEAVAEHTFAYLLMMAKQIAPTMRSIQDNSPIVMRPGIELSGKTLGVIGMGNIGKRVAEIAKAFGMKVLAWNRTPISQAEITDLENLLQNSDFISMHIALNSETLGFLDKAKVSQLKKGVFIANLSEKSLVDNDSLYSALESGTVAGYGVELWSLDESSEHAIYKHPKVLCLPGIGWLTEQALARTYGTFIGNGEAFIHGTTKNRII